MEIKVFLETCDLYLDGVFSEHTPKFENYKDVYETVRNEISDSKVIFKEIELLRKQLAVSYLKNGKNINYYFSVLDAIKEGARVVINSETKVSSQINWSKIIEIILINKDLLYFSDASSSHRLDSRLISFAESYIRLENLGVVCIERNKDIYISEESHSLINSRIDELCNKIGGKRIFDYLLKLLNDNFDPLTGRYLIFRKVSMSNESVAPEIPYGYLFALAAKWFNAKGEEGAELHFEQLVHLISDLVVMFEVQPYNMFEVMHLPEDRLVNFLTESVIYDNLVSFSQIKGEYAKEVLQYATKKFIDSGLKSSGHRLNDIKKVAVALISLSRNKLFVTVNNADIAKKSNLKSYRVKPIMEAFFAFKPNEINSSFTFPPSSLEIDYQFKPAINMNDRYYIFPKSIAALCTLNSVLNVISRYEGDLFKNADSDLGYEVEGFLRNKFKENNISFVYGEYELEKGKVTCECDLIAETDDKVYIFEVKKKGLTRKSLAGHGEQLLSDLADSVLRSHLQTMRIERYLKERDFLILNNPEGQCKIALKGRMVERISVSLNDFGSFQDKVVLQRILTIAISTNAKADNHDIDKSLTKWREYSIELQSLANTNGELSGERSLPFHNSYFVSVPQIMTVLKNSNNSDGFFKKFGRLKSLSRGTRDFYKEFLDNETLK
ncbi:hypothetical protein AB4139_13760 [Vibrio cyclitrophicus]